MVKRVTTDERDPEQDQFELDQLSEGATLVASGVTLIKAENENMQAVSVARPRDERKVLDGAMEELELVPDLAARNFYSIPYSETKGSDRKFMVEGPGIKAAMSLARRWGNCVVRGMMVGEDEEKVYLSGVFLDLETNFRVERPFTVSKLLRRRDGRTEVLREQRLVMAIQSGASKAIRNAILNGLPDYLIEAYYQRAKSIASREAKTKKAEIISKFREFGVTPEMLQEHVGHSLDRVTDEEVGELRGIYNAIKDGVAQPTDVFTRKTKEDLQATKTVDDIVGAGAKVVAGTEAAPSDHESPSETPASSPRSSDPESPESDGETIGTDGALLLTQTAKVRAEEIGAEVGDILSAITGHFGVNLTSEIPKKEFTRAIKLASAIEWDQKEEATPKNDKPTEPENEEVSKAGETKDKEVGF
jgi:hypothetical protein